MEQKIGAIFLTLVCIISLVAVSERKEINNLEEEIKTLQNYNEEISNHNRELITKPKTMNIYEVCEKAYNVPSDLLKAIEKLETGNYESALYKNKYNTFGCKTNSGDWCEFDSIEQSTLELARTLSFYYNVKGSNYDLEEINLEYCPNDPEWANKVRKMMEE